MRQQQGKPQCHRHPVVSCDDLSPLGQDRVTTAGSTKYEQLTGPPSLDDDARPASLVCSLSYCAHDSKGTIPLRARASSGEHGSLWQRSRSCAPCLGYAGDACHYAAPRRSYCYAYPRVRTTDGCAGLCPGWPARRPAQPDRLGRFCARAHRLNLGATARQPAGHALWPPGSVAGNDVHTPPRGPTHRRGRRRCKARGNARDAAAVWRR